MLPRSSMTPRGSPPPVMGKARAPLSPCFDETVSSTNLSSSGGSPVHTGLFSAQARPGRPSPRMKLVRRHASAKPSGAASGRCQTSMQRNVSSPATQNTATCQPRFSPSVLKTRAAASSRSSTSASKPSIACWAAKIWRLLCCCLLLSDSVRVNLLLASRRRSKRSLVSAASRRALRSLARDSASSCSRRSTSTPRLPAAQVLQSDVRLLGSLVLAIHYLADDEHAPCDAIAFDRSAPGLEASQGSVLAPDGEPHGE